MSARLALSPGDIDAELPRLRRYARVLTGEVPAADGLLVDTLYRASKIMLRPAPPATLRSRLFALLHETYADGQTRFPRRPAPSIDGLEHAADLPLGKPLGLLRRFECLPVQEREVLLLVAVEEMSYQEAAGVLHVPIAAVVVRLKRARERIHAAESSVPSPEP